MGSAGAKVASVVQGLADVYVHAGGQYEWDSAAPVAVARAAGLHTSRIDGSPLKYNQRDVLLPDLHRVPARVRRRRAGRDRALNHRAHQVPFRFGTRRGFEVPHTPAVGSESA